MIYYKKQNKQTKNQCKRSETVVKISDTHTAGTARRMDDWTDGHLQSALQSACDARIAAACPARHFCHVDKIAIFPVSNVCNCGLKWRAVSTVQLSGWSKFWRLEHGLQSHIMVPPCCTQTTCRCLHASLFASAPSNTC